MSDTPIKKGGGAIVRVKKRRRRRAAPEESGRGAHKSEAFRDGETTRYIRRRGGEFIEFLDLGTRLMSRPLAGYGDELMVTRPAESAETPEPGDGNYNAYVEVEVDAEAEDIHVLAAIRLAGGGEGEPLGQGVYDPFTFSTQHLQADLSDEKQSEFDAALLGSRSPDSADAMDPLGETQANGSERQLPHCMPVWFGRDDQFTTVEGYHSSSRYPNDIFDLIVYHKETGSPLETLPNARVREIVRDIRLWANDNPVTDPDDTDTLAVWNSMLVVANPRWTKREAEDADAAERWTPRAVSDKQPFDWGSMKIKEPSKIASGHLKLDARLVYEPFDTGDTTNYKVTREPSFDADEVPFSYAGEALKIYLKPQYLAFGRTERLQCFRRINFETYRYATIDGDEWTEPFNHTAITSVNGWLNGTISITPLYDGAAGPITGSVTITLTNTTTGAISYAGLISGSLGGGSSTTVDHDGYRFTITSFAGPSGNPPGSTLVYTFGPDWNPFFLSASYQATVERGMHVGRWPVAPRALNSGWDSILTFDGQESYDLPDDFYDSTVYYDANLAAEMAGRNSFHGGTLADTLKAYNRHASKEKKLFLYNLFPMHAMALAGAPHFYDEATARAIFGSNAPNEVLYEPDELEPAVNAAADLDAEEIRAGVEALGAHIRNTSVSHPSLLRDLRDGDVIPLMHAPAGLLAGILVKNAVPFYVWRKTSEDREKRDYERDQGILNLD